MRARGTVTAGLLGVLGAVALGCGDDSALLRQADAAGLKDTLEQVRSAVDARDCSVATARLRELRSDVGNLPGSVDRRLRVRLRQEIVEKLDPAVEAECDAPRTDTQPTVTQEAPTAPTAPEPEPEPTPPPPTATTPPPTQPTETTTPPPEDTAPAPAPDPPPKDPTKDPGGFGDQSGSAP